MLTPDYLRELAAEGDVHPDSWSNDVRAALRIVAGYLDDLDQWLERERFKSRQDGYALRIADERDGIGADRDEWLETPKEDADG